MSFIRIQADHIDAVVLLPFMVRHSHGLGALLLRQAAKMTII
jgi:hypothetical protein